MAGFNGFTLIKDNLGTELDFKSLQAVVHFGSAHAVNLLLDI